ncbi:MAG: acyl-CoA dehydrogenase family protein, partial [Elusimicrobiota bacterium]
RYGLATVVEATDYALDYALQRRQFGAPLTSFQLVQELLADTATELEAARLLTYQAAGMLDRGQSVTKQASFAKLYAARMAVRATQAAVQILGGYGYTRECPVERFYRDAMLVGIGGGTSQIQQLIIARELVKERARR